MVEEAGGFGENHRILSNRSTQNHVGEPRYFEIVPIYYLNPFSVSSHLQCFFSLYLSDTLDGRTTLLNLFSYYKYESYLNRTTWGPAFGFGIEYVRFIQVGIIESSDIRTCKFRFTANILSWTFFKLCAFLATLAAGTLSFGMCTWCFLLTSLIYLLCSLPRSCCTNLLFKSLHERIFADTGDAGK
jgi:hypothetical protein